MCSTNEHPTDVIMSNDELMLKELERRDGIYSFIFHELESPPDNGPSVQTNQNSDYDSADDYLIQQHLNDLLRTTPDYVSGIAATTNASSTSAITSNTQSFFLTPIEQSTFPNPSILATLILTTMTAPDRLQRRALSPTSRPKTPPAPAPSPNPPSLVEFDDDNPFELRSDPLLSSTSSSVLQHTSAIRPLQTVLQHTSDMKPPSTVVQHTSSLKALDTIGHDIDLLKPSLSVIEKLRRPSIEFQSCDFLRPPSPLLQNSELSRPLSPLLQPTPLLRPLSPLLQCSETLGPPSPLLQPVKIYSVPTTVVHHVGQMKAPSTVVQAITSTKPPTTTVLQHTNSWQPPTIQPNSALPELGVYDEQPSCSWQARTVSNNSWKPATTVLPPISTLRPSLGKTHATPTATATLTDTFNATLSATTTTMTLSDALQHTRSAITWGNGYCHEPIQAHSSRPTTSTTASSAKHHECCQPTRCPPPPYRPPPYQRSQEQTASVGNPITKENHGSMNAGMCSFTVTHRQPDPQLGAGVPLVRNRVHYLKETAEYKNFFKSRRCLKRRANGFCASAFMKVPDLRALFPHDPDVHAPFKEATAEILKQTARSGGPDAASA